jgi:hypothetical protein
MRLLDGKVSHKEHLSAGRWCVMWPYLDCKLIHKFHLFVCKRIAKIRPLNYSMAHNLCLLDCTVSHKVLVFDENMSYECTCCTEMSFCYSA